MVNIDLVFHLRRGNHRESRAFFAGIFHWGSHRNPSPPGIKIAISRGCRGVFWAWDECREYGSLTEIFTRRFSDIISHELLHNAIHEEGLHYSGNRGYHTERAEEQVVKKVTALASNIPEFTCEEAEY